MMHHNRHDPPMQASPLITVTCCIRKKKNVCQKPTITLIRGGQEACQVLPPGVMAKLLFTHAAPPAPDLPGESRAPRGSKQAAIVAPWTPPGTRATGGPPSSPPHTRAGSSRPRDRRNAHRSASSGRMPATNWPSRAAGPAPSSPPPPAPAAAAAGERER
eukprot:CAMPEP_0194686214 /NCGR_PEP_ID=MMETSP0295-20121207/15343_1 /TAXON_ID=39354 /ORGANISM="Heterosigma akashiwo, Strain CCMP2393" /LENGTH=159 /DNA_ID=CAMNT_0039573943 /DNA_START=89 /DNA_END=565 /DNA_ORIENTATION=+